MGAFYKNNNINYLLSTFYMPGTLPYGFCHMLLFHLIL